jgi:hypothetical protein
LCQSCLRGLGQRGKRITAESLEVHHIEGLASAWRKRLDSGNLITLCADCHGEAERGDIAKGILSDIAAANERECGAKAEEIPPAFVI